jgi:hypothetical protein
MVSAIAVGFALFLVGLGILGMLVAGIKALSHGKTDLKKIIMMAVPFVVFGISYAVIGQPVEAGVITMLFLMAAMLVLIAFTGLRGILKF